MSKETIIKCDLCRNQITAGVVGGSIQPTAGLDLDVMVTVVRHNEPNELELCSKCLRKVVNAMLELSGIKETPTPKGGTIPASQEPPE